MSSPRPSIGLVPLVLVAACLALGAAREPDPVGALASAAGEERPLLRIGLESAHRLTLSSGRPYRVVDPSSGADVWRASYSGESVIVAEGGPEEEPPRIYRTQAGSFATPAAAEAERARLEKLTGEQGTVARDPDRGSWRVRIGKAAAREALLPLLQRLRAAGLDSAWIADEPAEVRHGVTLRLVDPSYESRVIPQARVAVIPGSGAFISVEGKAYRGIVEVRVGPSGHARAIDWVGLEAYLRGVVPAEMGPEIWPRLEALKAQAVAARTYAWRNRRQFEDEGFDLCATPRCQVYGGVSAEHPLSDRAVSSTRGEILTWQGKPISALYTATCGGHTEDAALIFPEEAAPYLKGVPCRAENDALTALRLTLEGRRVRPVVADNGDDVTRDWALLAAAGIVDPRSAEREPRGPATFDDLRSRTLAMAGRAGLAPPRAARRDLRTLAEAAVLVIDDLGWTERARVLVGSQDVEALLRDPAASSLPEEQRLALAYLAWIGALRPYPDGTYRAGEPPTGARLVPVLARIGESYDALGLREATIAGSGGRGRVRLILGKGETTLAVAAAPFLFSSSAGRAVPAAALELWPGDRIRFRRDPEGRIDFLEVRPPVKGVSDDRSAAVYSWEVRRTRAELEESLDKRLGIGTLTDLRVVRRGASGRVVELSVRGTLGSAVVKGFDVRSLLDLRESLIVVEPQHDDAGRLIAVVFAGKGWGHGVGLCQVGAFGMATRGSGYREILGHYYRGAVIGALVPDGREAP